MTDFSFNDAYLTLQQITYKSGWKFEFDSNCDCPARQTWKKHASWCEEFIEHASWCEEFIDNTWRLRLTCPVEDVYDSTNRLAYGRWWSIPYQTKGDVVRTAFLACLTMEEHECRELFKYKGLAVFGPHLDLDLLVEMAGKTEHQPDFQTEWLEGVST